MNIITATIRGKSVFFFDSEEKKVMITATGAGFQNKLYHLSSTLQRELAQWAYSYQIIFTSAVGLLTHSTIMVTNYHALGDHIDLIRL